MKKTLLIALMIIPFLAISQTTKPIEGFLGIKFGSTKAVVLAAMKAKGAKFDKENSETDALAFDNVKLGSRETNAFIVHFFNDQAYAAYFFFTPKEQPQALDYYKGLVNDINQIYGKGKLTTNFKSPYEYGDGHEITAIQGGYAKIFTDWQSDTHSIRASTTHSEDEVSILLTYQDDTLFNAVQAAKKAKEKSDF